MRTKTQFQRQFSIIAILANANILKLSVAVQEVYMSYLVANPKDRFSHDVAQKWETKTRGSFVLYRSPEFIGYTELNKLGNSLL